MNRRACPAVLGIIGLVLALATGCDAGRHITSVYAAPFPEGPRSPVAAANPKKGEIVLSRIAAEIPAKLPTNPPQHCKVGAIVRITFNDGKTVTYGPCTRPASIERLRLALNAQVSAVHSSEHPATAAEARLSAGRVRIEWANNVRLFTHPKHPPRYRLIARASDRRLIGLASRYKFRVVSFTYAPRAQAAALTVQTSTPPTQFAHALAQIVRVLDPQRGIGFTYRGFFLEARDVHGTPFIAIQHSISNARGQVEGGQWARSESLLPYPHG